jgi:hypothetical protein
VIDYFLLFVCATNLLLSYFSNKSAKNNITILLSRLEKLDKIESNFLQQKANDDIQNSLNKRLLEVQNKRYSPENRTLFRSRRIESDKNQVGNDGP